VKKGLVDAVEAAMTEVLTMQTMKIELQIHFRVLAT
jgi:hypothetical protein